MDAIPPRFDVPAEVRRADDCMREKPCVQTDDVHDQHDQHDHEHLPEVVEALPAEIPPRQMLDVPQRVWREQAEQQNRVAQIVTMMNRRAAVCDLPPAQNWRA